MSAETGTARKPAVWLRALGGLGLLGLLGGTALVGSARWFWLGEVAVSFTWYLGLAGLAGGFLLVLVGMRRAALVALALGLVHVGPELWLWVPHTCAPHAEAHGDGGAARTLTLVSCNRRAGAPNVELVPAWLRTLEAELAGERGTPGARAVDVVAIQEANRAFLASLDDLRDLYPYQAFAPPRETWHDGTFGTAVLSRWPFVQAQELPAPPGTGRGPQDVVLDWAGTRVTVRNAHPMRPGKAWRIALRDSILDQLAGLEWPRASLLAGDLNMTSRSPMFGDLMAATGLRDSRRGFGRQPTFVVEQAEPLALGVPIDHVLVGDAWCVLERATRTIPASDHAAVVVELALVD